MIAVDNLTVAYGPTFALRAVSVEITPGAWGLFGPNAAGKSTLMRALAGLVVPLEGHVVRWESRASTVPEEIRRRIGWAGHQPGLYPKLTVRENLDLFASLWDAPAEAVARIIGSLGLEERSEVPAKDLSAGFQRRVTVARALVHDPDLLLLDEPFANLDDEGAERVTAAIVGWHRGGAGRISVVATHGAKRVRSFADAGIVLRAGRLAAIQDYRR